MTQEDRIIKLQKEALEDYIRTKEFNYPIEKTINYWVQKSYREGVIDTLSDQLKNK
jgi:hypothetical protein